MKEEKQFGVFLIILGIGVLIQGVLTFLAMTELSIIDIYIPILVDLYYRQDILLFISFVVMIILTITTTIFSVKLNSIVKNKEYSRFSVYFSIGSILIVILNFFTWFDFHFSNIPLDDPLYGSIEWDMMAILVSQTSLINNLSRIIGFYFLIRAWIQFSKCNKFSLKQRRMGKFMVSFNILAFIESLLLVIAIIHNIRYFKGKNVIEFEQGDFIYHYGSLIWFGIFILSILLLSIGYILVGVQIRTSSFQSSDTQ